LIAHKLCECGEARRRRSRQDEYRNGIVDFTTVLAAAATELDARDTLVQSRQALAQARISLYKALGGGWSETVTGAPSGTH
jgi:outer membrane protein TolC